MSWSLALENGDFTLSGSDFGTVTDGAKLLQDMVCATAEPMGLDDMHPSFGSLIDGGTRLDGIFVPGVIGQDPGTAASTISSEVQRIASAYQQQQLGRAKSDRINYNRVSLTPGEVLISIASINTTQSADTLFVTVVLNTALGTSITAVFPVATNN